MMRILLLQIFSIISLPQLKYREIYKYDYSWAVKFVKKNKRLITRKASKYGSDKAVITSVIFPVITIIMIIAKFSSNRSNGNNNIPLIAEFLKYCS